MYLSRLILNPRNRRVCQELANPYELHRTLMRAFPKDLPAGERVLFRVDVGARTGVPIVLLQSHGEPDWAWLEEPGAKGYLLPRVASNPATKAFRLTFTPGQMLAFRLRANPTVKRRFPNGDHKRVGLYREEEQVAWLERKGEQGGFQPLSVHASNEARVGGFIRRTDKPHKLNLLAVQFDGLLRVTDPERLWETVRSGIGSGKGLGFGLLSLARPGSG
jgi:CRISPR system Cascade subunit CasE